ncbi:hypothetical protein OE749_14340 [Aestuariibacter sp. AA17]|uniref:Orphan protein n=1 Tax=Fluctibacter corallii TaxID=2984329 RepID=A0ABT3AB09_9ALTE|nr:DUF6702 family protein [Aestuariibacter sp. AA17]MCV2885874.1 hypothetical protein [Aestuariibacter sp. AA17]
MNSVLTRILVFLAALMAANASFAHQQKAALTKVLFNARTGNIEIMHRFNLHDAEHATEEMFGQGADIIQSEKTQKQFQQYVTERFALLDKNDDELPLTSIGYEVDGKFFWVYQETAITEAMTSLKVIHHALRDIWPKQSNMVNVEGKGKLKTLTFDKDTELLEINFQH